MAPPSKTLALAAAALLALLAGCAVPGNQTASFRSSPEELVVRFQDGIPDSDRQAVRLKYGARAEAGVLPGTEKWRLPRAEDSAGVPAGDLVALAASVRQEPGVKYATPNYTRRVLGYAAAEQNGSSSGQWGNAQIRAPQAWETYFSATEPPGKGITVAVLDSGVDVRHPDLEPNVARDAYGNVKYIDVLHEASGSTDICGAYNYDWATAYKDGNHPGPDGHGHGTHVAGIIAAAGNNTGASGGNIVGVAPGASILPVKTMNCNGDGQDWDIAFGIKAAADSGARILNLSIGGPEPSELLEDALAYAMGKGVLVVVAAGNGFGSPVYYPAAYEGVIAVGAVDRSETYQSYSNVGPQMGLVAPGGTTNQTVEGILSTVPTYGSKITRGAAYYRVSGTSQASPFVAGVAALIWSREPSLTAEQVRARLLASARDLGPSGFDDKYGWGRVDALAALALGDHRYLP